MPFTLRNVREDLEGIGSRFDGARDLEFRAATEALELEKSGLGYQRVPPTAPAVSVAGELRPEQPAEKGVVR